MAGKAQWNQPGPPAASRPYAVDSRVCAALGAYAVVGGLVTFLGWVLDLHRLTDWIGYGISMQPNTALAAAAAGLALLMLARAHPKPALACGLVTGLIGGSALFENLSGVDLGIDTLFMFDRPWGRNATVSPGRMGLPGSISWTLIGAGLILARSGSPARRFTPALGLMVTGLASLSLIGVLFGADRLYTLPRSTAIAAQTATMIVAVGLGLIAVSPDRDPMRTLLADSGAGMLARRAVPLIIGLPILLGYLQVLGQREDLYDAPMGAALLVLVLIAMLCAILGWGVSAVNAREQSLSAMKEALLTSDRRKDEFLAILSHELRNPLAPIRSAARIMGMYGPLAPEIERQRELVERQAGNMARLLEDLLDVTRISQGSVTLKPQGLDLSSVAAHACEACRSLMEAQQHELQAELSGEPLPVLADRLRLEQVVMNLLNNAGRYTDPGGMIRVRTAREGNAAVLRVIDNGRGISPDVLPRIFELFVQDRENRDGTEGGLGIGLTLSQTLIELQGGRLEAHSEGLGRGSEFVVRLPLCQGEGGSAGPERCDGTKVASTALDLTGAQVRTPETHPSRIRVLVVDDNEDAADSLAELLGLWGYEVRTAYSGSAGIALTESFAPHIVFLDIGMPGMDGYETAARIRKLPELDTPLLAALTGYGQADDRRRAREAGFDEHLIKPVDPDQIERLLSRFRTHS